MGEIVEGPKFAVIDGEVLDVEAGFYYFFDIRSYSLNLNSI